jgi:predicted site-specific integrase-resolvase
MKLIDYAHKTGISYKTAWRWYKAGKIQGKQMDTGTILVTEDEPVSLLSRKVAIYARVSSAENKSNLDTQADRLVSYCAARGYQVAKVVKEVGSGSMIVVQNFSLYWQTRRLERLLLNTKIEQRVLAFATLKRCLRTRDAF